MSINLISPTYIESACLIADLITSSSGSPGSVPIMTRVNGVTVSAALEIQSSLGGLLLPRMTTIQKNALLAVPGMQVYDTDVGGVFTYNNSDTWTQPSGTGTVTSVNVATIGTGVVFTGGPITGSGTISATLDTSLQSIADLVSTGFMVRTGSGITTRAITSANSTNITISNTDGVAGNPQINLGITGVVPGNYTSTDISVDEYGRITSAGSGGGSGGAPSNATYILQMPDVFLPDAQSLSALSSGIMKSATSTGVVSIAVPGTDYYSPGYPTFIADTGFAIGNFFIGSGAGNNTYTSAEFNTGLGINSLHGITTGIQNTFAGHDSGILLTSGRFNAGFGQLCLASITTNDSNSALGFNAANAMTTGSSVVAVGANAMSAAASALQVTVVGANTSITSGITNSGAFGYNASVAVSNAINIGNGCLVGFNQPTPLYSLDIGTIGGIAAIHYPDSTLPPTPASGVILYSNSGALNYMANDGVPHAFTAGTVSSITLGTGLTGSPNPIVSTGTISITNTTVTAASYTVGNFTVNAQGQLTAASSSTLIQDTSAATTNNLGIGFTSAASLNLAGIINCISIGDMCGAGLISGASNNTFIGVSCGNSNTSASYNSAHGYACLLDNTTQSYQSAFGYGSLFSLNDAGLGTSTGNSAFGANSAYAIFTGAMNCAFGYNAGAPMTSMNNCSFFGATTSSTMSTGLSNSGAFGANTNIDVSNAINLGSGCKLGINNPSPAYTLDIANVSSINAVNQAIATVIPAVPTTGYVTYTYTANTTNTANLNLQLFTLTTNQAATVEVTIRGATTTLSDFTGGNVVACAMRAAGNISLVGSSTNLIASTTGTFSISVNTGSQAVILNATGIASSTYDWVIAVKYILT